MTEGSNRRRRFSRWCATVLLVAALVLTACSDDTSAPAPGSLGTGGDPLTIDARLIDASERGDLSEVQKLLAVGSSVRYTDDRGRTALIAAAYANQVNVAKVLIATGADVNVQDASQQSAYLISTSEGYVELLTLTLANGADVKGLDSFNGTGLIRAAHRGHGDIVRQLLRTNIDVDHVNRLGWTALLESILLGDGSAKYVDVVTQLVAAKADVNLADGAGVTPLQHARRLNQTEIATILERSNGR
ncbi:MAG TPA: ankyrin repeat domain-containing protein [Acidimicrobiales bacterium]|nr:ankyrin repeat domain-containing protein [Acidimicrobiales bacterium]